LNAGRANDGVDSGALYLDEALASRHFGDSIGKSHTNAAATFTKRILRIVILGKIMA
jgi:hypothetical protein